jgi:hypothetical protein
MAKVKKTYRELIQLANAINVLSSSKEHAEENNKGVKKLQKVGSKLKAHVDAYNDKLEDVRLDNALTDSHGALFIDDKGVYKYSKESIKKLNKDINELLDQEFEFEQLTFSSEGFENYQFLQGWVEGLEFSLDDSEED